MVQLQWKRIERKNEKIKKKNVRKNLYCEHFRYLAFPKL